MSDRPLSPIETYDGNWHVAARECGPSRFKMLLDVFAGLGPRGPRPDTVDAYVMMRTVTLLRESLGNLFNSWILGMGTSILYC